MAKKFHFPFRAVQLVRLLDRLQRQREMADAQRDLLKVQRECVEIDRMIQEAGVDGMALRNKTQIDARAIRSSLVYAHWLTNRRAAAGNQVKSAEAILQAKRERLVESAKRVKVIEKLRDKLMAVHQATAARVERIEHDEIAVRKFGRDLAVSKREGEQ